MSLLCLVLSLLPPYGGFNILLVRIFYICFYSYNFNSPPHIERRHTKRVQKKCVYNISLSKCHKLSYENSQVIIA
jgi:hypothetical protein